MPKTDQQVRLEEAFERIEETILPCISMMLETLLEASEHVAEGERVQGKRRPKPLSQLFAAGVELFVAGVGFIARVRGVPLSDF